MSSETLMISIKFLMFYALEFIVIALVGGLIIVGLYHLLRSKVRQLSAARIGVEST